MARKKVSPPPPPAALEAAGATAPPTKDHPDHHHHHSDDHAKLENLKTLNGVLVKQTMEMRDQMKQLRDQMDDLSVDHSALAGLEQAVTLVVLGSQMASADEAREVEVKKAGDRVREAEEKLRAAAAAWARSEEEQKEEIERCWREMSEVREKKETVERRLISVMEEKELLRRSLEDAEQGLERVREERDRTEKELERAVAERAALRMDFDLCKEEVKVMQTRAWDLERRAADSDEALERARMEYRVIAGESKEKGKAFQALLAEKGSLEKCLTESLQLVEDLKREMAAAIKGKENEMEVVRTDLARKLVVLEEAHGALKLSKEQLLVNVGHLEKEVDLLRENDKGQILILSKLEKTNGELKDEIQEKVKVVELVMLEKSSLEKSLSESGLLIEDLKRELAAAIKDKEEELQLVRTDLSKKVVGAEESSRALKRSEERLLVKIGQCKEEISLLREQEKAVCLRLAEVEKANEDLQNEIRELNLAHRAEIEEKVRQVRGFEVDMEVSSRQIDVLKEKLEIVMGEKGEIECLKVRQESDIRELEREVEKLSSTISALQESGRNQAVENRVLEADKCTLQESLGQQLEGAKALKIQIDELQKCKDDLEQELDNIRATHHGVANEMKERERSFNSLIEEKALADKNLAAAHQRIEDMSQKLEAANNVSFRAVSSLKNTVKTLCGMGGEEAQSEAVVDEEIQPFVIELEAIKKVYQSKTEEMEVMKRELRALQESVEEAKKSKGFWAWMSSASTVVAALSVAYATKVR